MQEGRVLWRKKEKIGYESDPYSEVTKIKKTAAYLQTIVIYDSLLCPKYKYSESQREKRDRDRPSERGVQTDIETERQRHKYWALERETWAREIKREGAERWGKKETDRQTENSNLKTVILNTIVPI